MNRKTWNIQNFSKVNLPSVIGFIKPEDLELPTANNAVRVLDLPIFMPDQGWRIPDYLKPFYPLITMAWDNEMDQYGFADVTHHYVYITVDQKFVTAGKTGRRAGAHSDAYIESNNQQVDITGENSKIVKNETGEVSDTIVWSDHFPTEFFDVAFPLEDTTCDGNMKTFNQIADSVTPITYKPGSVLKMDPFVVHRSAIATYDAFRTFVKISISKKKYARQGNTINPLFNYNWEMTVRSPETRNHPWS